MNVHVFTARHDEDHLIIAILKHEPTMEECWELLGMWFASKNPTFRKSDLIACLNCFTESDFDITLMPVLD